MATQIFDQSNLEKVRRNSFCSILKLCTMHKVWEIGYGKSFINYGKSVSIYLYCKY